MPFLSVRSFTLTNSELITKKTIYTKILTLPFLNFERNSFLFFCINFIIFIIKKGQYVMKKKLLKLITAVFVGSILLLPQYCPEHHQVDDCWKISHPFGTNDGHK
ncbi:hypothetical protein BO225_07850 [Dubosiella newyorkensis]|uniref:Uncharacterized protein n=5 Tax=Dubosiella newyorkensis TaxID=1862672 RepID=A0A1U7NLP2_9FIRM|nr:hypothetical protein BO225_07850 [Dubosiella newyorkensis]